MGGGLLSSGCSSKEQIPTTPRPAETPKSWATPEGATELAVTKADRLVVAPISAPVPEHPYHAAWKQAGYVEVALLPQQVAMPRLEKASLTGITVQAMHDGKRIAWRLSWPDSTVDGNVDSGRFCDAVALMFPIDKGAVPFMGHKGAKVQILHWKALWQKDVDVGFQDVQDLHPNFWSDVYWFAEGKMPFPVTKSFKNPTAMQWFIAHQAGNPVAALSRTQPVEDLIAEGFGTLTTQPSSGATGRGGWFNDRWTVVIVRSLTGSDQGERSLVPGDKDQIAFAAWQGSDGNVGGRKHWSNWNEFEISR